MFNKHRITMLEARVEFLNSERDRLLHRIRTQEILFDKLLKELGYEQKDIQADVLIVKFPPKT